MGDRDFGDRLFADQAAGCSSGSRAAQRAGSREGEGGTFQFHFNVMEAAEEPAKDCVSDSDSDSDSGYRSRGHGSSEQSVTAELGDGVSEEGVFDGRTQTPMSGTAASSLD
jgi:hypothetical protein